MNGLNNSVDHALPTETTALLASRAADRTAELTTPSVEPVLVHLRGKDIASCTIVDFCPYAQLSGSAKASFSLIVLFYLRSTPVTSPRLDVWEQWSQEQQDAYASERLDRHICQVWLDFLHEERGVEDIEEVLWQSYPYDGKRGRSKRVVDFLYEPDAPQDLLTHRILFLSLLRTWKYGRTTGSSDLSLSSRLLRKYDAACTPRVLHAIDLSVYSVYLIILARFLVLPPSRSIDPTQLSSPDMREGLLVFYSVAKVLQPVSMHNIPFVIVLVAFSSHLPSVPFPDDFAYGALLFAFSWSIIALHLPHYPSPIHLFPFDQILPLTILIWHGISRIFIPVVIFFLPALFLSLFLLSTSLWDVFPEAVSSLHWLPAPMETRVAFLILFSITFLLLLCSLGVLLLVYPTVSSEAVSTVWDRYTKPIGMEARRAFVRLVVAYSSPHSFPPPFNLLHLAARLPAVLIALLGPQYQPGQLKTVERGVWRVTIAPLAWVVGGFWLWGLRA